MITLGYEPADFTVHPPLPPRTAERGFILVVVVVVCLNRCVVQSRFLGSKKLNSLIDSTGLSHKFTVDKSLG